MFMVMLRQLFSDKFDETWTVSKVKIILQKISSKAKFPVFAKKSPKDMQHRKIIL